METTKTKFSKQEIINRLIKLQEDVNLIKNKLVDSDCILDEEDREALELAEQEFREGKTVSLEEIERKRKSCSF